MSRLIVPSHARQVSEIEQRAAEARQVLTLGFVVLFPGHTQPMEVRLGQPVRVEAVAAVLVKAAFDKLGEAQAEAQADRVLNGHVN